MANPGTRFNKIVSIGNSLAGFAALAATVMLYVGGQANIQGNVRSVGQSTTLTQSGVTSTEVTSLRTDFKAMTATGATGTAGGGGQYPTFYWANPLTQSAALLNFCLDIYTAPSPTTSVACYIVSQTVKNTSTGSATQKLFPLTSLRRGNLCFASQVVGSGSYGISPLIGPGQAIKCSNGVGAGSGQGLVGDGMVRFSSNRL